MSDYGHGLKVGDICVLYGLGDRWDETRMEVKSFTPNRVEGTITYKHHTNTHSYRVGGALNIKHEHCKAVEGDPPPIPDPPKVGDHAEVTRGGYLGLQLRVTNVTKLDGVTRGVVVFRGSNDSRKLGASVSFYTRDLKVIAVVRKPRMIFAKDGGWGP